MYSLFAQQAEPRWLEFLSNDHLALLIPITFILVYGIVAITCRGVERFAKPTTPC